MTKKILLFLFILSALPLAQLHAQTVYTHTANNKIWHYTVSGGKATITGATNLDNSYATGELNIPTKVGTALEYDVTAIGSNAFYWNTNITKLTANSVKTIGERAFRSCIGLTSLELPNVTTIGNSAFYVCSGLTGKLELPNVTTIGDEAFNSCAGLTGKLELPKVTTIGNYAFSSCSGLTSLELPNVTTIGNSAFTNCTGLTGKLELPKVTTIGNAAFYYCSGLTGLELPNVTTIGNYAFTNCTGLTGKLELPNVTTIGNYAFFQCTGLTGLELPNLTSIGNSAFYNCSGLTGLELPNLTSIGNQAFQLCSGLTGKLQLPQVTTIGDGAFYQCRSLTGLELPTITTIGDNAFYQCFDLAGKLELPRTLTSIGRQAFSDCRKLTAATFEYGTYLTNFTGQWGFQGCPNLLYIDMAGVTFPSTFTTVDRSNTFFGGTSNYTMVYLPNIPNLALESNEENFVIGNTCNRFVVYDNTLVYKNGGVGCDYPIQHPFTATTAEYQSRFLSGATCKTVCLPYKATLPNRVRAYKLVAKTRGGKAFRFVSIGDGNGTLQLEANTPYLLRVIDNGFVSDNWRSNNVQVAVTPATIEVALPDGQTFFGGTTTNIDNATAASNNYYNLENDTWRPIKTSQPSGYVHSFRAYIRTTSGAPAKGFAMVIDDDENATTDIDNAAELTEDELRSGKHTFYTLDGRRAGTNYDTLKSGEMYVVKGQKFYKF